MTTFDYDPYLHDYLYCVDLPFLLLLLYMLKFLYTKTWFGNDMRRAAARPAAVRVGPLRGFDRSRRSRLRAVRFPKTRAGALIASVYARSHSDATFSKIVDFALAAG